MEKVIMLVILMMAMMVQKGVGGLHEDDSRLSLSEVGLLLWEKLCTLTMYR